MKDFNSLLRQHWAAVRAILVFTVLLGVVYPFAVTGIVQLVAPRQANGSLIADRAAGRWVRR